MKTQPETITSDGIAYVCETAQYAHDHPLTIAYVEASRWAAYLHGWVDVLPEDRSPASQAAYFMFNTRPDGRGWNHLLLLHAEYEVRKENTFPGSGYWEVVTVDHPIDDPATYGTKGAVWQHALSCSTERDAYRQLARIQDAQHRLRHVAAMLELTKNGKNPELAGMVGRKLAGAVAERSVLV